MIANADIGLKSISDHSWISCDLQLGLCDPRNKHWSLNTTLLTSDLLKAEIAAYIRTYLSDNSNSDTSEIMVWDALKATLRGSLIAKSTHMKKQHHAATQLIMQNIQQLEDLHKTSGSKKNSIIC